MASKGVESTLQIGPAAKEGAVYESFRDVLSRLVRERGYVYKIGNPNWRAFSETLNEHGYESLRKALAGERWPTPELIEDCAQALKVEPTEFHEYRMWLAQRQFDPRQVGLEEAMRNLEEWTRTRRGA